jgi:hypothetical protein
MPQESKARPSDAENAAGESTGFVHEQLEGSVPSLASELDIRTAMDKAFDYRGDVTITLKDGSAVEGYVFDRRSDGPLLSDCSIRLLPKDRNEKRLVRYSDIAGLQFTGRDTASGKSWEAWVRKYQEKKAAGQTNIRLEPEALD